MTAMCGKGKDMNQKGYNNPQNPGNGQPSGYPSAGFAGGATWPEYVPQQGYPQQGYPQTSSASSYQAGQGYPAAQGYQAGTGYQAQQGYRQQGYQTPQVSGAQPRVSPPQDGAAGNNGQGIYYQNPYAQQNYAQGSPYSGAAPYTQSGSAYQQSPVQAGAQTYPYQGAQSGSYIPQMPYQGYSVPGYQQTGGYGPGYNAYVQMGRGQQMPGGQPYQDTGRQMAPNQMFQDTNRQVPLNGGGYVPQAVPVRRRPFEMTDADLLILSAIMLILFALGMFVPGLAILKWFFLILGAGTIALLWLKPLVAANKRLCYTIVFGLLIAVTVFRIAYPGGQQPNSNPQGSDPTRVSSSGQVNYNPDDNPQPAVTAVPNTTVTSTPEPADDSSVTERLQTFFYYWSANRQDDMLTLCAPSWQSKVENPKTALFGLMANRTPKEYMVENITGTEYDTSRTVTVVSLMDRNNGKDPVRYRLSVIMLKENDNQWYVDPKSLQTYEAADTPDPSITPTPGPTDEPVIYPNTVLYYNPSGGEFYHLDQNCKRINERYLPLQGHFTYAELSKDPYNKLKPCAICGAPSKQ